MEHMITQDGSMYMFKKGTYWMHSQFRDIFIEILRVNYVYSDKIKLKIRYWNLGYTGKPYAIYDVQEYVILAEEYKDWIQLNLRDLSKPRTKPGLPI